jgi:hypothetical protein
LLPKDLSFPTREFSGYWWQKFLELQSLSESDVRSCCILTVIEQFAMEYVAMAGDGLRTVGK